MAGKTSVYGTRTAGRAVFAVVGAWLLASLGLGAGTESANAATEATEWRAAERGAGTRFVLEISEKPAYRLASAQDPKRLIIDLSGVTSSIDGKLAGIGLIRQAKVQALPDRLRLTIEVQRPVRLDQAFMLAPSEGKRYRLVLDMAPGTEAEFAAIGEVEAAPERKAAKPDPVPEASAPPPVPQPETTQAAVPPVAQPTPPVPSPPPPAARPVEEAHRPVGAPTPIAPPPGQAVLPLKPTPPAPPPPPIAQAPAAVPQFAAPRVAEAAPKEVSAAPPATPQAPPPETVEPPSTAKTIREPGKPVTVVVPMTPAPLPPPILPPPPRKDPSESPQASAPPVEPPQASALSAPSKPERPFVVALDAGHGGADPGAIGRGGVQEKTITLAMVREIKALLEADGHFLVMLTRTDDSFVRLRERVARARLAGAQLFVSIHADVLASGTLTGSSVYTLSSTATDREAEALATKENKADVITGVDLSTEPPEVSNILIDLAQRETNQLSTAFAEELVREISSGLPMVPKPHRAAGFAVLTAPDIPSVLIELGYLSDKGDAQRLQSPEERKRLADAIARAIDRYAEARRGPKPG